MSAVPPRPGRALSSYGPVAGALVGAVAGPVLVGVRGWRDAWVPKISDLRQATLATQAATHLQQLTGPWSRIGLPHPGPLWTYWCVPFLAAAGTHPKGLVVAAVALAVVAIGVVVVVSARAAGRSGGIVAAAVVVAGLAQMSLAGVTYPWNATIVILPTAAGLVAAADAWSRGSLPSAGAGALLGAMVAQSHLGGVAPGGLIIGASLLGVALARRVPGHRPRALAVAALVAVAVGPWLPVLADQVVGEGTPAAVARYALTGDVEEVFPAIEGAETQSVSAVGALRRLALVGSLAERGSAAWGGAEVDAGLERGPTLRADAAMALLVVLALAGSGVRRLRPAPGTGFRTVLLRLGLVALALEAVGALQVRDELRLYVLATAQGVGLALWLGVALAGRDLVAARVPSLRATPIVGGAVAAVLLATALVLPGEQRHGVWVAPLDDPAIDALEASVPEGTFVVDLRPPQPASFTLDLVIALEERGRRVAVVGPYVAFFSDRQRRATPEGTPIAVLRPDDVDDHDCQPVGRYLGQLVLCIGTARPHL